MKGVLCVLCVLVALVSLLAPFSRAEAEGELRCRTRYTILNGFLVEQNVRITLPAEKRDLAVWLVEKKTGAFKKLAYPIGGEGRLRISQPFDKKKYVEYPFILTWQPFGGFRLTGFFLSRRHAHTVVVRESKNSASGAQAKRIIEIFPPFPGHLSSKLAQGECDK